MNLSRRSFLTSGAAAGAGLVVSRGVAGTATVAAQATTRIHLLRHATSIIHYAGRVLMVDPMLADPGAMPPITNSPNPRPNPLVPLPVPSEKALTGIDAILVTHTHPDHWDAAATKLVPKATTLFIQPPDAAKFAEWGFANAQAIQESITWKDVTISRTGAQHGRGEIGKRMAPVSGYVLRSSGAPTLYIAGDTVWCPEVEAAIKTHTPDLIVLYAGAAQFLEGGSITMDTEDVLQVCRAAPKADVIAVHMEAINHCVLTRPALRAALERVPAKPRVRIPNDGEELRFS